MQRISSTASLRAALLRHRQQGKTIALVATMGNLHAGHLALVNKAKEIGDYVVVTIFVNPSQFAAGEDYQTYPHTLDTDLEKLSNVDIVFTPEVNTIYPTGYQIEHHTAINVPGLSTLYCGKTRPRHFQGVATIVAKLFNLIAPNHAIFGAKDYQQTLIIRRMIEDLNFPITLHVVDTVREKDGLAMSSRNNYLSQAERQQAPELYHTLLRLAEKIRQGEKTAPQLEKEAVDHLSKQGFKMDYLTICDAETLDPAIKTDRQIVLAAVWLGKARLIDNIMVKI